ncbi:MFS transporter [Singulisphaera sp. PoT]|uniref:MFS transporter n=1 Tax=Singulisphaera sp. PoT TaxID=3411797 RepID=UPI003BF5245E
MRAEPLAATAGPLAAARLRRGQSLTMILLIVGYGGYYLCRSNLSVATPLMMDDIAEMGGDGEASRDRLGKIASLGTLAYAIGKFFSGVLGDIQGGRRNFLTGMGGTVVFTALLAVGPGSPLFALSWLGNRLVQSMGWVGIVKIASRWFDFRTSGGAMAVISLSYLFGDAASRAFMGVLIHFGMGWRGLFLTCAGVLAVIFVACSRYLKESPREIGADEGMANPLNIFGPEGQDAEPTRYTALIASLLSNRAFLYVCLLSLTTTLMRETFNTWSPTYFKEVVHLSVWEAAITSALFPLVGGVSVLLAGFASDRLGPYGRAGLLVLGLATTGVALWFLGCLPARVGSAWPIFLVTMVGFLLIGPYSYLGGAIALDFGGKRGSSTACGIIDGTGYLAAVLAGDGIARAVKGMGWGMTFSWLAITSWASSLVACLLLWELYRKRNARGRSAPDRP